MSSIEKEVLLNIISNKLTTNFIFHPKSKALFEDLYECACNECAKYNAPEEVLDNCYFHIDELENRISVLEKKQDCPFEENKDDNQQEKLQTAAITPFETRVPAIPFEETHIEHHTSYFGENYSFSSGLMVNYSYI